MHINGLSKNTLLQIVIKINRQEIAYDTKLMQAYNQQLQPGFYCIGCAPVLKDGKLITFGSYPMYLKAHDKDTGRDYRWDISMHGFNKDRTQFLLFSNESVKPVNHRGAMRIPCHYKVVVLDENSHRTIDGRAYDISASGVGVLIPQELTKAIIAGDKVSLSIYDDHGRVRRANGTAARIVKDFKPGETLVGIRFDRLPIEIEEMIIRSQRK